MKIIINASDHIGSLEDVLYSTRADIGCYIHCFSLCTIQCSMKCGCGIVK